MKRIVITMLLAATLIATTLVSHEVAANSDTSALPSYTADGKLQLPADYRDWIFLTSGFGMNYSNGNSANPMFTNVYVSPVAYQGFKATAKWPDKSMFIVEIYSPASHGSINKGGHYQDAFMGLDVEVKDSSRPQEWSYYNFGPQDTIAEPAGQGCNNCHSKNGAVEHTFVQFYPTLLDFAIEKNVVKPDTNIPLNATRFLKIIDIAGWEKAEQAYYEDRKKNPDSDMLNEHTLNMTGYILLQDKKMDQAISIFKLMTKSYPDSANAYDSLADGYAAAGKTQLAIASSQKELSLVRADPTLKSEQKKRLTDLAQKRIADMSQH